MMKEFWRYFSQRSLHVYKRMGLGLAGQHFELVADFARG